MMQTQSMRSGVHARHAQGSDDMSSRSAAVPGGTPDRHRRQNGADSKRRRVLSGKKIAFVVAICVAVVLGGVGAGYAAYMTPDYSWYTADPSANTFTVSTAGQMQAFANLVNGTADLDKDGTADAATDFTGKTVQMANNINLMAKDFDPIGTPAHPFAGTFEGSGYEVRGLKIAIDATGGKSASTANIGLFGVASSTSSLRNVTLNDSCSVNITSDSSVISKVGSLVGNCQGTVVNCSSSAVVTLSHTATDISSVASSVVIDAGGLIGTVQGPLSGASYKGSLKVTTPANAYADPNDAETTLSTVAEHIGGIVGSFYGDVSGCSNAGSLLIITSGKAGLDRFGSNVDSKSLFVGGVGGYGEGNVTACSNSGTLFSTAVAGATLADIDSDAAGESDGGADGMGGIVGSLRGVALSGMNTTGGDLGMAAGAATLTLSDCSNTGYVSGLHAVGGIVGTAGTKTSITRCVNGAYDDRGDSTGHVRTTRWNKPGGGGIAGQSYGAISYCRNHGVSENTKTGFYTAGIVGMLVEWDNQASTPEVYACYSTGQVFSHGATASFYEGGIVGENNGYIHDNVFLAGTVSAYLSGRTSSNDLAAGRNFGTCHYIQQYARQRECRR